MNPVVNDFTPVDSVFLLKIRVEARFNVFYNGLPTRNAKSINSSGALRFSFIPVVVVDKVTKTRCIDNGQMKTNAILLDICM